MKYIKSSPVYRPRISKLIHVLESEYIDSRKFLGLVYYFMFGTVDADNTFKL